MSDFKHPIEELIHSTVRIECVLANAATSTGSGYFYVFFESEDKHRFDKSSGTICTAGGTAVAARAGARGKSLSLRHI